MSPLLHDAVDKAVRQAFTLGKQLVASKRPEHQAVGQALDYAHCLVDQAIEEEVRRRVQVVVAAGGAAP